jgi:hypothetical protein
VATPLLLLLLLVVAVLVWQGSLLLLVLRGALIAAATAAAAAPPAELCAWIPQGPSATCAPPAMHKQQQQQQQQQQQPKEYDQLLNFDCSLCLWDSPQQPQHALRLQCILNSSSSSTISNVRAAAPPAELSSWTLPGPSAAYAPPATREHRSNSRSQQQQQQQQNEFVCSAVEAYSLVYTWTFEGPSRECAFLHCM